MDTSTKLRLLAGKPLYIDNFGWIKPKTLSEIVDIGYEEYYKSLSILITNIKDLDIYEQMNEEERDNVDIFTLSLILSQMKQVELLDAIVPAIEMFSQEVELDYENLCFVVQDGYLSNINFKEFQQVLKYQHFIVDNDEDKEPEFKPANKKAEELIKKMLERRKQVDKAKAAINKDKELDLYDIISAVSSKSNSINKLNVWDMTLYQLYDEFNRLRKIDDYQFSVDAMMVGAKDIKLEHWSSKMK